MPGKTKTTSSAKSGSSRNAKSGSSRTAKSGSSSTEEPASAPPTEADESAEESGASSDEDQDNEGAQVELQQRVDNLEARLLELKAENAALDAYNKQVDISNSNTDLKRMQSQEILFKQELRNINDMVAADKENTLTLLSLLSGLRQKRLHGLLKEGITVKDWNKMSNPTYHVASLEALQRLQAMLQAHIVGRSSKLDDAFKQLLTTTVQAHHAASFAATWRKILHGCDVHIVKIHEMMIAVENDPTRFYRYFVEQTAEPITGKTLWYAFSRWRNSRNLLARADELLAIDEALTVQKYS